MTREEEGNGEYVISKMSREELNEMIDIAVRERWTESYDTIDSFYNIDPNGFFAGKINGKIVSTISAVKYPDNYGFLSFYIVDPNYRKKGYGIKIFQHAMEYLKGYLVGLDAVAAEVQTYQKSGFVVTEGTIRFIGTAHKCNRISSSIHNYDEKEHFEKVAEYDKDCFPSTRKEFLREWLVVPTSKSFIYSNENNNLKGYISCHRTCRGYEIAPCYAESKEIAKELMIACINALDEGIEFGINCPDNNDDALCLVKEITDDYQIRKKFSNSRMYANGLPNGLNTPKFFSLLSLSVG